MTSHEDFWYASPWIIVLCLGAAIVVNVLWRLGERLWWARYNMRDHGEWLDEVRQVLFQLIDADLHRAQLTAKLAELIGRQPEGFDGVARESFARSLSLTPVAAAKAEEAGLFPPGTFAAMGVPRYDGIPPRAPSPAEKVAEAVKTVTEPVMTWVGTVKVPKRDSERPPPGAEN